jgi:hypothetical protein
MTRHELFGERLGALELCSRGSWTQHGHSAPAKAIREAQDERRFGTDDDELVALAYAQFDDGVDVRRVDRRMDTGIARNTRVAGCAIDLVASGLCSAHESVLSGTGSNDENSHGLPLSDESDERL